MVQFVEIVASEESHGPEVVDGYVRVLCAAQLSELSIPHDMIESVVAIILCVTK